VIALRGFRSAFGAQAMARIPVNGSDSAPNTDQLQPLQLSVQLARVVKPSLATRLPNGFKVRGGAFAPSSTQEPHQAV